MAESLAGHQKRIIVIDLWKHVGTLSVAAIGIMVAFLADLKALESGATSLTIALTGFVLCVLCSVLSSLMLLVHLEDYASIMGSRFHRIHQFITVAMLAGFLTGVLSLSALVAINLT